MAVVIGDSPQFSCTRFIVQQFSLKLSRRQRAGSEGQEVVKVNRLGEVCKGTRGFRCMDETSAKGKVDRLL